MSSNKHEKLVRSLTRNHNATIKRLEAARDICSVGTNSYRQYEQAVAEERRKHTAQLVEFGIVPENLGRATKDEFLFVSHVSSIPTNREELAKVLTEQQVKSCKGLDLSVDRPAYNAMCDLAQQLNDEGDSTTCQRIWQALDDAYKNSKDRPDGLDQAEEETYET